MMFWLMLYVFIGYYVFLTGHIDDSGVTMFTRAIAWPYFAVRTLLNSDWRRKRWNEIVLVFKRDE